MIAIMDQVSWRDLLSDEVHAPALRRLAREGGVGMMCVRTARTSGTGGGYLTIGAGSRATAPSPQAKEASLEGAAFQVGEMFGREPAGQHYRSLTGWALGDSRIVHLGIGELLRQNLSPSYPLTLGLLGGTLRRSGLRVACVGNADTPEFVHRELVAIGMDERGQVELGDIGVGLLRPDPGLPYGSTTDGKRFLSAFRKAAAAAHVIVVDFGDTSRAAGAADLMPPSSARQARDRAIEAADRLLSGMLTDLSRKGWGLLLLTPAPRAADPEEHFVSLTPIISWRPDGPTGLLTSPSTRRPGLVVNTDVAASVLAYFGIEGQPGMVGRPMRIEPAKGDVLAGIEAEDARQGELEIARRYSFRWLAVMAAIVLWAAAGMLALGDRVPRGARVVVRGLLLVLLGCPPALLLVGLRPLPLPQMLAGAAGLAFVIAVASGVLTGWRAGHALPACLLVALLAYDLLKGATMLQWSPLSYSAAAGARFYGVGNEYGGALLGSALVAAAALLAPRDRSRGGDRLLAGLILLGIAALVGHPRAGANLGMALASAVGFGAFLLYLWHERPTWGDALAVLVLAGLLVGGTVAVDLFARGAEASHVGLLASQVRSEGGMALAQVAARKWTMNWALVHSSLWTDVVLAAFGLVGVVLLARPRRALAAMAARPWLAPASTACVVGAVASWAFNDSGIVAAALVMLYGAGSLAYLGLEGA